MPVLPVIEDAPHESLLKPVRNPGHRRFKKNPKPSLLKRLSMALRMSLLLLPLLLLGWGVTLMAMAAWHWWAADVAHVPPTRPTERVVDMTGRLHPEQKEALTRRLLQINRTLQADWVLVLVNPTERTKLAQAAEKILKDWKLGQDAMGHRGGVILLTEAPVESALAVSAPLEPGMGPRLGEERLLHLSDLLEAYPWDQQLKRSDWANGLQQVLGMVEQGVGMNTMVARSNPFEIPTDVQWAMSAQKQSESQAPKADAPQPAPAAKRHANLSVPNDAEPNSTDPFANVFQ